MFGRKKKHNDTMRMILENQEEIMRALAGLCHKADHEASKELMNRQASKSLNLRIRHYPRQAE